MSASHTLSYDARRRALLSSSYSPRLSDPSQFPVSAILAKLPPLPYSPSLDAPEQPGSPTPPASPTPDIAPPVVPTTGSPAVNGLGIDYGEHLPQIQGSDSEGHQAQAAGDLRPAFKTQPLDDHDNRHRSDKKKRYLGSRSIAWWTRFSKRG